MKNLLIAFLILCSIGAGAQPTITIPLGTQKTTIHQKGWIVNDSGFVFPVLDTTKTPYFIGETRYNTSDTTLYIAIRLTGAKWMPVNKGLLTTSVAGVASVNATISGVLGVSGGPFTGAATIPFVWNGASTDVVLGNGSYTPLSGAVTSITNPLYSAIGHGHVSSDISDIDTYVGNLFHAGTGLTYDPLTFTYSWTGAASGITTLNGLTGTTQTFAVGTSGSDFGISSVGTAHTFNLPKAALNVTGKLDSADWRHFDSTYQTIKSGSLTPSLTQFYVGVGNASNQLSGSANLQFQSGGLAVNSSGGNDGVINYGYSVMKHIFGVSSPASGYSIVYVDASDGHLKQKISSGTIYDLTDAAISGGTPALTQYRLAIGNVSNQLSTAAAITGNKALVSDANGVPTHSATTATQIGYLSTLTSDVQTQINSKEATFTTTSEDFTGSTSLSFTLGHTIKSGKVVLVYYNGLPMVNSAVTATAGGTTVTITLTEGRLTSDKIKIEYPY